MPRFAAALAKMPIGRSCSGPRRHSAQTFLYAGRRGRSRRLARSEARLQALAGSAGACCLPTAGGTAAEQLAQALVEAVDNGRVGLHSGSELLLEIAKLRAARVLWSVLRPESVLHIHVCTAPADLVGATTEAMSAVIGGCDSLTVVADGFDPRLALNIQRILREETRLGDDSRPRARLLLRGSIDRRLAREAWKLFQKARPDFRALFFPQRGGVRARPYRQAIRRRAGRRFCADRTPRCTHAAVDHPAVRRILHGGRIERVLPAQSRGGPEGPLGGIRPGDAPRLRFR